jgi:hypothetical protein
VVLIGCHGQKDIYTFHGPWINCAVEFAIPCIDATNVKAIKATPIGGNVKIVAMNNEARSIRQILALRSVPSCYTQEF